MSINLFFSVVIAFCLGYLFRDQLLPAYWRHKAEKEDREKYQIDHSVKHRQEIGEFLNKIESRLWSIYNVNGTISKEILSEFNSYIWNIGQSRPFNNVYVEWTGNKSTFTITVTIDGQEFILVSLWNIRDDDEFVKGNYTPVFIPV